MNFQSTHVELPNAAHRTFEAKARVHGGEQESVRGKRSHGDDVQLLIVHLRAGNARPQRAAEDGCIDDRELPQFKPLGSSRMTDLTGEGRCLSKGGGCCHRVTEAAKAPADGGTGGHLGELDVQTNGGRVGEVARTLPRELETAQINRRHAPDGQERRRLAGIGGNSQGTGEVVGGAQGDHSEHDTGIRQVMGHRADAAVAAGRDHDHVVLRPNHLSKAGDVFDVELAHNPQTAAVHHAAGLVEPIGGA